MDVGEEQSGKKKREKKTVFENNFQSLTHLSIPIDNHFNNFSINPHSISLSLSLSLWMKTQTHTLNSSISIIQIIINPSPQQQPSMSTHSHFINNTLNLSLKTIISLLNPQNQSLPPFSLIHLIQFNNVIELAPFISLIMNELSQVF